MATSVLVDGRALGGDGAYRGFGRVVRSLLAELAVRPELEMAVLVTPDAEGLPAGVEAVPMRRRAPGRLASLEHDLLLPGDINRRPEDVFHGPGHDPPRRCERPWVQTLHDVIPLTLDDPAYRAARRRWRSLRRRFRQADAVVADSRATARDGVRVLGLDPARVHVAPLGVDGSFTPGPGPDDGGPPYVLFVAELGPNKGHAEAFAAIGALADRGLPHRLLVTGRLAPWVRPQVEALRASAPHPERIDLLGHVPDEELVTLYRGAAALLVTSRAEGFGLPALEAMACATPVVAFANSSIPEVVGNGGVLVPDGDVGAAVDAVARLATDPSQREELAGRARQRAAGFTWAECAAIYAQLYEDVAARA